MSRGGNEVIGDNIYLTANGSAFIDNNETNDQQEAAVRNGGIRAPRFENEVEVNYKGRQKHIE